MNYPHKFNVTKQIKEYIETYSDIDAGQHLENTKESVTGRVVDIRKFGKLYFIIICSDHQKLQLIMNQGFFSSKEVFSKTADSINRGNIIGAHGFVGKSKKGKLSLIVNEIIILTPCLTVLPCEPVTVLKDDVEIIKNGLQDEEEKIKRRHLDLICNPNTNKVFRLRARIITAIRDFLDSKDFVEVQTPILSGQANGAQAKPFITQHNHLDQQMYLRIAPELYLKKLIIGGFDRVYELGPQFRNESCDATHNPEFYSLEFYMAYTDYYDMMQLTTELMSKLILKTNQTFVIKFDQHLIDFTPPYKIIDIIPELESILNIKFPSKLNGQEAEELCLQICEQYKIKCAEPKTLSKLYDKIIGYFIEKDCINPTFLINHPLIMSPLAKAHRTNDQVSERFELFVAQMEIANSYTELNDSEEQLMRFKQQQEDINRGNVEAERIDESFIEALECGMPPTAGFGCGIERLVMILTNSKKIKDVILFPSHRI